MQKTNFQDNTWSRHQNTVDYTDAVQLKSGRAEFEKTSKSTGNKEITALQGKEKGVVALLKMNKFIVGNNMPLTTYTPLVQLCRKLKCPDLEVRH